jgi:hypothetical protein
VRVDHLAALPERVDHLHGQAHVRVVGRSTAAEQPVFTAERQLGRAAQLVLVDRSTVVRPIMRRARVDR